MNSTEVVDDGKDALTGSRVRTGQLLWDADVLHPSSGVAAGCAYQSGASPDVRHDVSRAGAAST